MKTDSLEQLRDIGTRLWSNTIKTWLNADYVIDIGPKAGKFGGEIISIELLETLKSNTITE
jgi:excinuclease ABC subunit A